MKSHTLENLTDEDLMVRIQKADHGAFSVLVKRHTKMFYAAAYRVYPHISDAEDVVQEAFLKLWKRPEIWKADRGAKFTTWFYRVVINMAIDNVRKKKNTKGSDVLDRVIDTSADQLEQLEAGQQKQLLEIAIQALPERQKIALNLCFYEGLSNKEAAEIMEVKVKALESLLMRAKAGLKILLLRQGALSGHAQDLSGDGDKQKGKCCYG